MPGDPASNPMAPIPWPPLVLHRARYKTATKEPGRPDLSINTKCAATALGIGESRIATQWDAIASHPATMRRNSFAWFPNNGYFTVALARARRRRIASGNRHASRIFRGSIPAFFPSPRPSSTTGATLRRRADFADDGNGHRRKPGSTDERPRANASGDHAQRDKPAFSSSATPGEEWHQGLEGWVRWIAKFSIPRRRGRNAPSAVAAATFARRLVGQGRCKAPAAIS